MSTNIQSWISRFFSAEFAGVFAIAAAGIAALWSAVRLALRSKQLAEPATYVLRGFFFSLTQKFFRSASARFSLKRYCSFQIADPTSKYLRVPGVKDFTLKVDDIFVPLALEQAGNVASFDHENFDIAGDRIRVIGDPGSGKSSLTKKRFRVECRRGVASPTTSRFPILIELKKVSFKHFKATSLPGRNQDELLESFMLRTARTEIQQHAVYEIDRCLRYFLSSPDRGVIMLLDGLDEVSSEDYPKAEAAINELSQVLRYLGPKNTIVLSMRTQFNQQVRDAFSEAFPVVLRLKPFTTADIYAFLDRWDFGDRSKFVQIIRIYNELIDRPTLRDLCTNPLILAMYVAHVHSAEDESAPESRTEFYERVTDELLYKRRARTAPAGVGHKATRDLRLRILGRIAFQHLVTTQQPTNVIPWSDALSAAKHITKAGSSDVCAELLREIGVETGLFTEEKEGETCYFSHLTFCEFFAAAEAALSRRGGWSQLLNRFAEQAASTSTADQARLTEVIPFACALLPLYKTEQAIDLVRATNNDTLLGLSLLETKAYDHPQWIPFIERQRGELLSALIQDSDWIRKLHLFLLVCIDANRTMRASHSSIKAIDVGEFIEQLAFKLPSNIMLLIDEYARQDAVAAFRLALLCHVDILVTKPDFVVQNCLQPPFFAMAIDRVLSDSTRTHRWSSALAEAGLRSLPVARMLQSAQPSPWRSLIKNVSYKDRWFIAPLIPRTALTECITYCVNSDTIDPAFKELFDLAKKKAVGRRYIMSFFARRTKLFLAIIWATCLATALLALTMTETIRTHLDEYVSPSQSRMIIASMVLSFMIGAVLSGLLMIVRAHFEACARKFWISLPEQLIEVSGSSESEMDDQT